MDSEKVTLVVCLTLLIVIGLNAAIYAWAHRRGAIKQTDWIQKSAQRIRQPWQDEDQSLEDLARRVADLKNEGKGG